MEEDETDSSGRRFAPYAPHVEQERDQGPERRAPGVTCLAGLRELLSGAGLEEACREALEELARWPAHEEVTLPLASPRRVPGDQRSPAGAVSLAGRARRPRAADRTWGSDRR